MEANGSAGEDATGPLKIALLAPPWLPVPPEGYGGIEVVIAQLADALVDHGHDVHLFAAPGSSSRARVRTVLPQAHPREMGRAIFEVDHVARVFDAVQAEGARSRPFDVVHDHTGFAALAMANRLRTPLVHTVHCDLSPAVSDFYRAHAAKGHCVAISAAQARAFPAGVPVPTTVPNPLGVQEWPYEPDKEDYLLWIGRLDEHKGPHRAIEAARRAERPLVLAGPVQPGQEGFFAREVEPYVDGDRVRYLGEVGPAVKRGLFSRAAGLLMPIRWNEPFGMVVLEALACGTPVIAFAEGAMPELVRHGRTGFLVDDERMMAAAVDRLETIDPAACRAEVEQRFDVPVVAAAYEAVYRAAMRPGTVRIPGTRASSSGGSLGAHREGTALRG